MNLENKKQIITLMLALLFGGVAVWLAQNAMQREIDKERAVYKKELDTQKKILVDEITRFKQKLAQMEANQEALRREQQELKKPVFTAAQTGGVAGIPETTVFSTTTPPGKRALTVMIDSLSAVGGLVNPGDFVDVIAHLEIPNPNDEKAKPKKITSIIMQGVKVLAVGANFRPIGNALTYQAQQQARSLNVTLALSADEASLLTFAQSNGKLQLALRPPTERSTQMLDVASWETLSDYVLDRQGTELKIPEEKTEIEEIKEAEEVKSSIKIIRGGREQF